MHYFLVSVMEEAFIIRLPCCSSVSVCNALMATSEAADEVLGGLKQLTRRGWPTCGLPGTPESTTRIRGP